MKATPGLTVHALEGSMLAARAGMERLLSLSERKGDGTVVYVISPVKDGELGLSGLLRKAERKDERLWSSLEKSRNSWLELAENTVESSWLSPVREDIEQSFIRIEEILRAVWLLEESSKGSEEYIASRTGSFLSSMAEAAWKSRGEKAWRYSVKEAFGIDELPKGHVVVYGTMKESETAWKDASGRIRTEGESEYTAALLAAKWNAAVTFWNRKSLLMSASIKDVPSAEVVRSLSYDEATELSFFGAPIVHPHSFLPAEKKGLPIRLRYWGDPEDEGTLVSGVSEPGPRSAVKAFSAVRDVALINVEGGGMSGVPGVSGRLFSALRDEGISVIFISQASSEHSICFAVPKSHSGKASRVIRKEFSRELDSNAISSISVETDCAILAAVGDGMNGSLGVAGKFFSSLAKAGVNIRAIAQGSSERNISAVIKEHDSVKALRKLHSAFFLSAQTLSVGLFGPGNIGGTLLDQIARESERLKRKFDLDIRIRGIASSKKMLLSDEGIDLSHWREDFESSAIQYNDRIFMEHIGASYYPNKVVIDCTSSEERAMSYRDLLASGFHIITPNKKAASASYDYYRSIFDTSLRTGSKFFYETTVGAGLPIIVTLKDLTETGDDVISVEGIFSGTLAWLFSNYDGTVPFSELVLKARELGFTEPDPRDDLSGMDVARKTVIIARQLGYGVELSDMEITSLVPEQLRTVSREEFLERVSEMDDDMLALYNKAKAEGKSLRYVGKVDRGTCTVSLEGYPGDHAFSQAGGTDNVIQFTTARYLKQPLVIKGPGAGPEVTAAGVFADLLRLGQYLGSRI